jgi:photosystem II stability/assembly factor-like uncharacterized protein
MVLTTDGGATWIQQDTGMHGRLMGVSFLDHYTGVTVGSYSGSVIVRTDDGGETWTLENTGLPPLRAVTFVDGRASGC